MEIDTKSVKNKHSSKNKKNKHSDKHSDKHNSSNKHIDTEPILFKATNVSISTCTVLTNLNSKINLGFISRFISVHDQYSPELDEKKGGIYNLEFYGNCARGETLIDKIKDEFNNQATVKFKYWGFRSVNVKFFANGKLQMTGLKYEDEAKEIANLLIDIINNINVPIKNNIESLKHIDKTYDFQLVYDKNTKNVFYYRKFYNRFLTAYEFDTDDIYDTTIFDSINFESKDKGEGGEGVQMNFYDKAKINNLRTLIDKPIHFERKGFIKGIHDTYKDTIEEDNKLFLKENEWYGDNYIKTIIAKIEHMKDYFEYELEASLINSYSLIEVKKNIDELMKKYTDFKFTQLDKILGDISKNLYSNDDQTLGIIKNEIFKYNKQYKNLLEKKVNRLINIRTIDITICNAIKEYLLQSIDNEKSNEESNENSTILSIPLEQLEFITKMIDKPHNYYVSGTETVLINSDLSINHNINLKKISKILKIEGFFNTYEPDDYPGVLTKYYYNPNNVTQGICNCPVHCSTREKHSICTKVTISIFRPGSIIITGARNTIHLMAAHDKILQILKDNIHIVKGIDNEDDHKNIAILNNEFRKISKKTRLFFIKKEQIIDYDKQDLENPARKT
jgi:TATA-box binding protein (TBP) (component of TFIID and TFIIIB)